MQERDLTAAMSVFTGLFILISACACPTVTVGDCGELSSCAHTLSIAHPPGFPLYCLLYRAFALTFGFMGSVVMRHNLLSSALTAGAAAFLLLALRASGLRLLGALAGAAAFGLSANAASQGMQSEVYALNLFLVALTVHAAVRAASMAPEGKGKASAFAFFCFGLAMANHPYLSLTALAPCLILVPWFSKRPSAGLAVRARAVALSALAVIPGFLTYLYLPLRSAWSPPLMWGPMNTVGEVLGHMARTRYGGFAINEYTISLFSSQVWAFLVSLVRAMGWIAPALALAGACLAIRDLRGSVAGAVSEGISFVKGPVRRPGAKVAEVTPFGIYPVLFLLCTLSTILAPMILVNYTPDIKHLYIMEPFFSQSHLFLAGLAALACSRAASAGIGGRRLAIAFLILVVACGVPRVTRASMAGDETARDYAVNILRCVAADGHVLSQGDLFYMPWLYLHLVEGYRTDVKGFQANGFVFQDDPSLFNRLMDRASMEGGAFFTNRDDCPETGPDGWKPIPHGLVFRATKKALEKVDGTLGMKPPPIGWFDLGYLDRETSDYMIMGVKRDTNFALAEGLLASGETREAMTRFIMAGEAVRGFDKWQYNLGSTLLAKGFYPAAIPYLEAAVKAEPSFEGARASLALCLSETGNLSRAVRVTREGIALHGETRRSTYNLGSLYVKADLPELAAEYYRKSLAIDPGSSDSAMGLFRVLGHLNRWDEVVSEVMALEKRGPLPPAVAGWGAAALVRLRPSDKRTLSRGLDWSAEWMREEPGRDAPRNALSILTGLFEGGAGR